jgi:hypothetical protein
MLVTRDVRLETLSIFKTNETDLHSLNIHLHKAAYGDIQKTHSLLWLNLPAFLPHLTLQPPWAQTKALCLPFLLEIYVASDILPIAPVFSCTKLGE